MDLTKHLEFFDPLRITDPIHIIGIGAIGSHIAELLTRLGLLGLHIYDLDVVEEKNLANQLYFAKDVKHPKVQAMEEQLIAINPLLSGTLRVHPKGYLDHMVLSGYVFLCVDSIELRHKIATKFQYNGNIKAMLDFRMRLSDAQHYAADWTCEKQKTSFIKSMEFTDAEAKDSTPVSACGTTLSVIPTIKVITALGVANFINYLKGQPLKSTILIDAFDFTVDAMGSNQ